MARRTSERSLSPLRAAARHLAAAAALLALGAAGAPAGAAGEAPARILVAGVDGRSSVLERPFGQAASAVLAELLAGEGPGTGALLEDLSEETVRFMDLDLSDPTDPPSHRKLTRTLNMTKLRNAEKVRILVLPSIRETKVDGQAAFEVELRWIDTTTMNEGTSSGSATAGPPALELLGRLAAEARSAWSPGWPEGGGGLTDASPARLLTADTGAAAAWARARRAWVTGGAGRSEGLLQQALEIDPAFGRARVDLAWIRLAQGRAGEAGSLAASAVEGGRLTSAALERATFIRTAAAGDGATVLALAETLEARGGSASRAALARAMGLLLSDSYAPAIRFLDRARLGNPNDPALIHLAGIAGLGAEDYYEARTRLERAVALWPANGRAWIDLAEARVRDHDLQGALEVMTRWRESWSPEDAPWDAESWSVADPPPPVRSVSVLLLMGRLTEAAETLTAEDAALMEAGASWTVRAPVLYWLQEMQRQLSAMGSDLDKQTWLDRSRESLRQLNLLVPEEERAGHPWIYDRLTALVRTREGRLEEAADLRRRIMESSGLPGYEPAVEAEIDAAITLKSTDTVGHFAACRRAVEARGNLEDHQRLAQAYSLVRDWKGAEEEYAVMHQRLETWSLQRRRDAYVASLLGSGNVPFIYYVGALARLNQGDAAGARERFDTFLAFFRRPDPIFRVFWNDAKGRGATPAW